MYLTGVMRSFKKPVLVFTRETLDPELVIEKAPLLILFANLFLDNFPGFPAHISCKKPLGPRESRFLSLGIFVRDTFREERDTSPIRLVTP